jgi:7,8-dihydropterin-6-yl-methyl-4-(beta-D-ribofuranosyl)aminobenzene 5'-phosphate synthase
MELIIGANYHNIKEGTQIINGVYSTGELGTFIKEQALVIKTKKGLVVLTGCAHPGVVNLARKAKEVAGKEIYLVLGGFHLYSTPDSEVKKIIGELKKLGVKKIAPCHCSGERTRQLFKKSFGKDYLENGVGRIIKI